MKNLILMFIFILALIGQNVLAQDTPASELDKARKLGIHGQKTETNIKLCKYIAIITKQQNRRKNYLKEKK